MIGTDKGNMPSTWAWTREELPSVTWFLKKKRRSKGRYNNLWWCYIGAEFGGARCADLNPYGELLTEPSCIRLYEAAGGASGVFAAPEC